MGLNCSPGTTQRYSNDKDRRVPVPQELIIQGVKSRWRKKDERNKMNFRISVV